LSIWSRVFLAAKELLRNYGYVTKPLIIDYDLEGWNLKLIWWVMPVSFIPDRLYTMGPSFQEKVSFPEVTYL